MEAFNEPRRARPQLRWQGRQDLEPRRCDHRAEPELRGGAGQAGEEDGLGLLPGEAGQPGAVAIHELDASVGPALGIDRDAGSAQGVHVPVDGPLRDLELAGQRGGGEPAP